MNHTKRKWTIKRLPITGGIAIYADDELIAGGLEEANAELIVTAVNACMELNPKKPMAVAESISDLYEALEYIIRELDKATVMKANSIFMLMPNKALAKAGEK